MNFTEQQTQEVTLRHRDLGNLGKATLKFGGDWGVVANTGLSSPLLRLQSHGILDFVTATTEDHKTFTLCDCTVQRFTLFAKCLVSGELSENGFSSFEVRYSDISEWFLESECVEGTIGQQLTWTNRSVHFAAQIAADSRPFSLNSRCASDLERIGENLILHEHVEFTFATILGTFSLKDVKDHASQLCTLLSLLIAYPVAIVSIQIHTLADRIHSLYFATFGPAARVEGDFRLQCLLQKFQLDGQWASILDRFYENRERRDLWARLTGMQRYDGFWDFRLLGYVGLLDRCVTQRYQAPPSSSVPLARRKLRKLTTALADLKPPLDRATLDEILGVVQRVFSDREASFADRYAFAMEQTDSEVRNVIDLNTDDFELIKEVRDRIAHGEPPEVRDADFPKVMTIISKIALLLTYWALHDLGIPTKQILHALNTTHNRLYLRASINRKQLARATNTALFFTVTAEQFEKLFVCKGLRFDACLTEGPSGQIELSDEHTARRKDWYANSGGNSGLCKWADILGVPEAAIRFIGTAYIESGDRTLELNSVIILDDSRVTAQITN